MPDFKILYDELQEAEWFRGLHADLADAEEESITIAQRWPSVQKVLVYDRPDIVLLDGNTPILVVEETVEIPSGHNVGQRFARLAAAAEASVPCLYFGPYVAMKHGGETAGPRYMNARLFHALDAMEKTTGSAITTVNWPVDEHHEVRRDPAKDADVHQYVATFMELYSSQPNLSHVNKVLLQSKIHRRMIAERNTFVQTSIRNPEQYDDPPDSVEFLTLPGFRKRLGAAADALPNFTEIVLYKAEINKLRADPYAGMAILYRYLYIAEHPSRALVLWLPNITEAMWREAAARASRKDVRLFRIAADAILFADQLLPRERL